MFHLANVILAMQSRESFLKGDLVFNFGYEFELRASFSHKICIQLRCVITLE